MSTSIPDFIFVTEVWLHADDIIILPKASKSHEVLRYDHLTHSGGVAVHDNAVTPSHNISTMGCDNGILDFFYFDIFPSSFKCVRFILVYRSPKDLMTFCIFLLITLHNFKP